MFIPHGGGPCFFMDWTWGPADTWRATQSFLERIASTLPQPPKAILVVSGHWEESAFTASAAPSPGLIFDYSGFPVHTYKLTWPAPGDPALAARVAGLLSKAGLPSAISPDRGYDHGVFVPLKVAFPLGGHSCGAALACSAGQWLVRSVDAHRRRPRFGAIA